MGKVLSPILGAVIGLITWYAVFLFFPLIVIPIVLGMWFLVKEPKANRAKQSIGQYLQSVKQIFEKKRALLLTSFFAGMTALLLLFGVLFFLSEYLEKRYHLQGVIKGFALAIPVLFMSVTSFITGMMIKKKIKLMKWLIFSGLALIAVSLAGLGIFNRNTIAFFAGISVAGIGTGLTLPCLNTIITSSCEAEKRGLITSLYGSVRFFGVALGPPLFGLLMDNRSLMFWVSAALAGVAALLAVFLIEVKEMKKPATTGGGGGEKNKGEGISVKPVEILVKSPAFIFNPLKKPDIGNKGEQ